MRVPLPQVDLQAGESPRYSAGDVTPVRDFRGQQIKQLGAATEQFAAEAGAAAQHHEERVAEADLKDKDNLLSDGIRELLYDPEKGYTNQIGEAATSSRKVLDEQINDKIRKTSSMLQSPLAQQAFRSLAAERRQRATQIADAHYTKQSQVLLVGASEARAKGAISDAVLSWLPDSAPQEPVPGQEPQKSASDRYRRTALEEVDRVSDVLGLPQDSPQRVERRQQVTTAITDGIVRRALHSDSQAAADVLAKAVAAGEVDSVTAERLSDLIDRQRHSEAVTEHTARLLQNKDIALQVSRDLTKAPTDFPRQREPQTYVERFALLDREQRARFRAAKEVAATIPNAEMSDDVRKRIDQIEEDYGKQFNADKLDVRQRAEQWLLQHRGRPLSELGYDAPQLAQQTEAYQLTEALEKFDDGRYRTDPATMSELDSWSPSQWEVASRDPKTFDVQFGPSLSPADRKVAHEKMQRAAGEIAGGSETRFREQATLAAADVGYRAAIVADRYSSDEEKLALQRWIEDARTLRDAERSKPRDKGEKLLTDAEILAGMRQREIFYRANPEARGRITATAATGRDVTLQNVDLPQIVERIKAHNAAPGAVLRDPNNIIDQVTTADEIEIEKRNDLTSALGQVLQDRGLPNYITSQGKRVSGFVSIADAAQLLGVPARDVEDLAREASPNLSYDAVLYYDDRARDEHGYPGVVTGVSMLALARLLQLRAAHR